MSLLWSYLWPAIAAGMLVGLIGGLIGFREGARRIRTLAIAAVAAIALAAVWHGPLGAASRMSATIDRYARQALDYYEMTKVTAHLHHAPLTRRLVLSGPADDFQTSELVRVMSQIPGVSRATWSASDMGVPLLAEGIAAALGGFLLGLLLAWIAELRRRHNAQWNW